jgi:hypothetical protein
VGAGGSGEVKLYDLSDIRSYAEDIDLLLKRREWDKARIEIKSTIRILESLDIYAVEEMNKAAIASCDGVPF